MQSVYCVDLGESVQTHIFLQNLVSIQPRTSPVKFARPPYPSRAAASLLAAKGRPNSDRNRDERRAPFMGPGRERDRLDQGRIKRSIKDWLRCRIAEANFLIGASGPIQGVIHAMKTLLQRKVRCSTSRNIARDVEFEC